MQQCCNKYMQEKDIFEKIREQGGRITTIRKKILRILSEKGCLVSQEKILANLKKQNQKPNRSTIFRELLFLTKNNIVLKNTISGIDYYEIPHEHHHHIVCLKCKSIKKIDIGNCLEKQEKLVEKRNNFIIINHSLEFYGYCHKCRI